MARNKVASHEHEIMTGNKKISERKSARDIRRMKILSIVVCPTCRGKLTDSHDALTCSRCNERFPFRGDTLYFTEPMLQTDALDSVKGRLKRILGSAYYTIGIRIFAPTFPFNYRKHLRQHVDKNGIILDIGSGNHRIDEHVITVDGVGYEAVDIVTDLQTLPFRTESIDCIASRSVLEHLPNLANLLPEIERCIRCGGYTMHLVPFLFPYHASPEDFQRFTASGAANLFPNCQIVRQFNATGPVSLFLLCFIEFMSILLSLRSKKLKSVTYLGLCLFLFPLKYIDFFFINRPGFLGLAPTIFTVARKRYND